MLNDFAVFILSHGRPDNIKTLKILEDGNYTGDWYIVIDNEDKAADRYYDLYGDKVIMFNKLEVAEKIDEGDNFKERRTVVYARNAVFDIAKQMGLKYFLQLDDDYTYISYRRIEGDKLAVIRVNNLDDLFKAMIEFLEVSGAKTVCFAQGGDLPGGKDNQNFHKGILRKAMNSFFCKTDDRIEFVGKLNEDVSSYALYGSQGALFFTISSVNIVQTEKQKNEGGITDVYNKFGSYVQAMYSVMYMPSAIKVGVMGTKKIRVHKRLYWEHCVPKILNEKYKKGVE